MGHVHACLSLNINIQITFHTNNTLHDILKTRTNNTNTHMRSGIYQLECQTCHLSYIGQTGRRLEQRYKEPTRYITSNKAQSAYALHILHNQHEQGPMNIAVSLLHPVDRNLRMNSLKTSAFSFSKNITRSSTNNLRKKQNSSLTSSTIHNSSTHAHEPISLSHLMFYFSSVRTVDTTSPHYKVRNILTTILT
jgi:hypothetical protein